MRYFCAVYRFISSFGSAAIGDSGISNAAMFEAYKQRCTDKEVREDIPAPIRAALWASIRGMPEPKDWLQTFRLSRETIDGRTCQAIQHTTGQPYFSETIRLWYRGAVDNFKVYAVDKGAYCVMQFPADS